MEQLPEIFRWGSGPQSEIAGQKGKGKGREERGASATREQHFL